MLLVTEMGLIFYRTKKSLHIITIIFVIGFVVTKNQDNPIKTVGRESF